MCIEWIYLESFLSLRFDERCFMQIDRRSNGINGSSTSTIRSTYINRHLSHSLRRRVPVYFLGVSQVVYHVVGVVCLKDDLIFRSHLLLTIPCLLDSGSLLSLYLQILVFLLKQPPACLMGFIWCSLWNPRSNRVQDYGSFGVIPLGQVDWRHCKGASPSQPKPI